MKYIFLVLFFILTGQEAGAYNIYIDKKGTATPDFVIRNADSLFFETSRPGLISGEYVVWLRITIANSTERPQFKYISFDNPAVYKADFYYYQDGKLVSGRYGFGYPSNAWNLPSNIDEFRVNIPAKESREVFVRLEPRYVSIYSYRIMQMGELIAWKDLHYYSTLVFVLIVLIILIFALFLLRIFPARNIYLAYILFLLSTILSTSNMTGLFRPFASYLNPVQVTELFVTCSLLSCTYFVRVFFNTSQRFPLAEKLLKYTALALLLSLPLQLFIFNYHTELLVRYFLFSPSMITFMVALYYLVAKKARYAVVTATGYTILTIFSVILNLAYLGFFELENWILYYQLSIMVAIIILFIISFQAARDKQVNEMATSRLNKLMMDKTQSLAKIASWNIDLSAQRIWFSDELYNIYGITPGEQETGISELFDHIHPDDRPEASRVLGNLNDEKEKTSLEFRICLPDGNIKYISAYWTVARDENHTALQATGYIQDVTEKVLAEAERNAISGELLKRNQLLEEFSYSVSHNLRSPLANILGLCDLIERKSAALKIEQQQVSMLKIAAGRMDSILRDLNALLNYDKQLNSLRSDINLDDIAQEAKDIYRRKIEHFNASFTWDFSGVGVINLVKPYMDNFFQNMLSNSLKYARPGIKPVIHFSGTREGKQLVLYFRDNGLGIDLKANKDKLFGIYQRFNPKAAEGDGLGLYLIKLQVQKMGGTIDVQSEPGAGTTFTILVPV